MDLRRALAIAQSGRPLTRAEARATFESLFTADADGPASDGPASDGPGPREQGPRDRGPERDSRLAALLATLALRGERPGEIAGCVDALRAAAIPFEHDHRRAIDTCGTGGDGAGSFNLSTAAALVAAGAGATVVKHGNRAVSSRCGSADLLEALGAVVDAPPRVARAALDASGFTFLFAPRHHPVLRLAAPVRRALGIRTLFNLVGPLVNPAGVRRQLVGVADARLLEVFAATLAELGVERGLVVHGAGGLDELALEPGNLVLGVGGVGSFAADAAGVGLDPAPVPALAGGEPAANRRLLERLLSGEPGPLRDAVLLNAAAALVVAGTVDDLRAGVQAARDAVDSGAARGVLARYVATTRRLAEEEAA